MQEGSKNAVLELKIASKIIRDELNNKPKIDRLSWKEDWKLREAAAGLASFGNEW